MCSFLFFIVYYNMNKVQFTLLYIVTFIAGITIAGCIGYFLPTETTTQKVLHIVLCSCMGLLIGVILALITIVFEATRKDN